MRDTYSNIYLHIIFLIKNSADPIAEKDMPEVFRYIGGVIRSIKSNSSRWIKGINPRYQNFSWQTGYGAFSVSESCKGTVTNYILNQKEHHKRISTHDEFLHFLEKNGFRQTDGVEK